MLPILRQPGTSPPCYKCPKQPQNIPVEHRRREYGQDITEKTLKAWRHYRECKAVGQFPTDEIVRRNALIISDTLEQIKEDPIRTLISLLSGKISYN